MTQQQRLRIALDDQFRRCPLDAFDTVMTKFRRKHQGLYIACRDAMGDAELYKLAAVQRKKCDSQTRAK